METILEDGEAPERRFARDFMAMHPPDGRRAERHWARECDRWRSNSQVSNAPPHHVHYLAERLAMVVLANGMNMDTCGGCRRTA
ncbi:hypothetical protein KNE206_79410 [Kitasatospora sp. NE20-6]